MKRAKNYLVVVLGISLLGVGLLVKGSNLAAPATGTWVPAGTMAAARSGAATVLLTDGRVLVTGGCCDAAGAPLATAEFFNSDGSFTAAPPMNFARSGHTATLLQDGRVLVAGGWDGTTVAPVPPSTTGTPNVLASSDIYDPAAGTVTAGPAMNSARMNFTATVQLDGKVAVIGGSNGQADLASIEVFDPAAGSFVLGGSLTTARSGHLAFLLPHNANILIVGGSSAGVALSSVELYTPWTAATSVTGSMASARASAAGSPLSGTVAEIGRASCREGLGDGGV